MIRPSIVFFRGLNTYGHDHAQLSVIRFGPMFKHMQRELLRRDVDFDAVLGMGAGPLPQVAARARAWLERLPAWADPARPVHFVAHSAGGLVARLVLDQLGHRRRPDGGPKIASLLTIATPHRGSGLAQIMCDMPGRRRGSATAMRVLGFDVRSKLDVLRTMTADPVEQVMAPTRPQRFGDVRLGSIVCAPAKRRWSRTMRTIHLLRALREFDLPSDGIVERDSQPFGKSIFEIELDHFQQSGFCGNRRNFRRMCDVVRDFAGA